ncbi:hypothetical protein E8E11_001118 [Didymella keratinophila]|nr:hypothetical protein E8E11_001118 [Didymella keratinophila]
MALTKDLGYKYLWVDRYCIAQQDAEVKHIQIVQMGNIYAMADLTIIAVIGSDPTHGLPGFRGSRSVKSARLGSSYISILPASDDLTQVVHSPWTMRAWTLQESVLSRRRLILTGRQAIFLCNTQFTFEAEDDDSENRYEASAFWDVGFLLEPQIHRKLHSISPGAI